MNGKAHKPLKTDEEHLYNQVLGSHIEHARIRHKMPARHLAKTIGVSVTLLYYWETGRYRVPPYKLHLIGMALGVPVTTFIPTSSVLEMLKMSSCDDEKSS